MNLTTTQIKDTLENPEDVSPKCLALIIAHMAERIEYLERCYMNLDVRYHNLEVKYSQLNKNYAKLHLNSMYGMMVKDTFEADKIISDAMNVLKENADND